MLEEIYDLDDNLSEDEYYDALLFLLGDAYPDMDEEELEDMLEDMLDQLPEQYAENVINTIGTIGKQIGNGTLKFAADNPTLVKGGLTATGTMIGGPAGAKLGSGIGNLITRTGQNKFLPKTGKTLALMQNPQAQAAITRATLGIGDGTAPLSVNGHISEVPIATYLRAIIATAQAALQELDRNNIVPPPQLTESIPFSNDIDQQTEWLTEQLRLPDVILGESLNNILSQQSLEERQDGANIAKYSTSIFDLSQVAGGENPGKRRYISIFGPDKRNIDPVRFFFTISNTNDTYNFKDVFLKIRLLAELQSMQQQPIALEGQAPGKMWKDISIPDIPDESAYNAQINLDLNALREAMKFFIANKDQKHKLLLEIQLNWKEGTYPGYDYYYDTVYYSFYLMNLAEIVVVNDNIDIKNVKNPIQTAKEFVAENKTPAPIEISITAFASTSQSSSQQQQVSQSQTSTIGQSSTIGVKHTSTNQAEVHVGLKIDEIVNAGFKSQRTDSTETSKSVTYSSNLAKTISVAYSNTDIFTQSISKTVSQKIILPAPSKGKRTILNVYPIFKPIEVDIYDYSDVSQNGFIRTRKVYRKIIMWKYEGPGFEIIEI